MSPHIPRCKRLKLVIIGPPGSGKSTQAEIISRRCGLNHIYMGDLLRREARVATPFAGRIQAHIVEGRLAPSDIVLYILERELASLANGFILDGFPRTLEQALELDRVLDNRGESLDAVVYLAVREEEITDRLLARGRPDDTPDIIHKRIEIFHAETDSVLRFYEARDILAVANGEGAPDEVADRILAALQARDLSAAC